MIDDAVNFCGSVAGQAAWSRRAFFPSIFINARIKAVCSLYPNICAMAFT